MEITKIYGFDYLTPHINTERSNFGAFTDLPFYVNNVYNGWSRFKLSKINGRIWVEAVPKTGSRTAITYRYCRYYRSRYSTYSDRWYRYCASYGTRTDTSATNDKRRKESSARSPSLNFEIGDQWGTEEPLSNANYRYYTFGIRFHFPSENRVPSTVLSFHDNGGTSFYGYDFELFDKNDLIGLETNVKDFYLEFVFDRVTGYVRRWVNEEAIKPIYYGTATLKDKHIQIAVKNVSTSGSAPPVWDYRFTDIYMARTNAIANELGNYRLGPIEVRELPVEEFTINRHWLPPSEPPTETVNRVKINNNTGNFDVTSDTHSDPGQFTLANPFVEEDEEVIALDVHLFGHNDGSGATKMKVTSELNNEVHVGRVNLPVNQLVNRGKESTVFSIRKETGEKSLDLTNLQMTVVAEE